jgi:hypothetical protein
MVVSACLDHLILRSFVVTRCRRLEAPTYNKGQEGIRNEYFVSIFLGNTGCAGFVR